MCANRSEGFPGTGYFTPGCGRGRDLDGTLVVMSRRRRRPHPVTQHSVTQHSVTQRSVTQHSVINGQFSESKNQFSESNNQVSDGHEPPNHRESRLRRLKTKNKFSKKMSEKVDFAEEIQRFSPFFDENLIKRGSI